MNLLFTKKKKKKKKERNSRALFIIKIRKKTLEIVARIGVMLGGKLEGQREPSVRGTREGN